MAQRYEAAVVGGGPAGLQAALTLGRMRYRLTVGPRVTEEHVIHLSPYDCRRPDRL